MRILNKKPVLSDFQACLLKKMQVARGEYMSYANRIALRKNWKVSLGAGNGSIAEHFLKVSC